MRFVWILGLAALSTACHAADFTIQVSQPRQTIRHFGASDAWSMQFIGLWEDETEQEKIADWLFSTENDAQGKPLGIGLSVWRFNLGAGSAEQGKESQIQPGTRTECFLTKNRTSTKSTCPTPPGVSASSSTESRSSSTAPTGCRWTPSTAAIRSGWTKPWPFAPT